MDVGSVVPDLGPSLPEGCGDGIVDPTQLCFATTRLVWADVGVDHVSGRDIMTVDLDADGREELLIIARAVDDEFRELMLIAYEDGFTRRWRMEDEGITGFGFMTHRDMNGDGFLDVKVAVTTGHVGIYFNEGGSLAPIEWFAAQTDADPDFGDWFPRGAPVPYDGDGDGTIDSLTATIWTPGNVKGAWLFSGVASNWKPSEGPIALSACESFGESVYGDFDGDGVDDFVVREFGGICDPYEPDYDPDWWRFYVFLSRPDSGTVELAGSYPAGGIHIIGTYAIDFDRDGVLDLVFKIANGVSFIRGRGDGSFETPQTHQVSGNPELFSLQAIADFDGDGEPDMLIRKEDGVAVISLTPDVEPERYLDVDFDLSGDIDVADLNGDGIADVLLEDADSEIYPRDRIVLLSTP